MNYKDYLVEIYFALKDGTIVDCIYNLFRSIHRVIFVIYIFIVYSVKNNFVLRSKNRNISIHLRIKILYSYFFLVCLLLFLPKDVWNVIYINFTSYKFYIFKLFFDLIT